MPLTPPRDHANRITDAALEELFGKSTDVLDRLLCTGASSIVEADPRREPEQNPPHPRQTVGEADRCHDNAQLATLRRLVLVTELKNPDLASHLLRISHYGTVLARALGLPPGDVKTLGDALALHDIGKIAIPDAIVFKPGALTSEERAVMRSHTVIGGRILAGTPSALMRLGHVVALSHHERWDGTGYPRRLCGEDIPLAGRICSVVDAFDAMTSARPYRAALAPEVAIAELRRCQGLQFDPRLVALFIDRIDEVLALHELFAVGAATPEQVWARRRAA